MVGWSGRSPMRVRKGAKISTSAPSESSRPRRVGPLVGHTAHAASPTRQEVRPIGRGADLTTSDAN